MADDVSDATVRTLRSRMSPEGLPLSQTVLGGRYHLLEQLGRGGMADVWLATDSALRRRVAVKVFRSDAHGRHLPGEFDAEVELAAGLDHPHLVRVYDAGTDGDRFFCVMQLVPGGSLHAAGLPLPLEQVRGIGVDIASALAHLHERGVVHRDVKPGNVLLGERGEAYLSDFGVSQVWSEDAADARGEVVGTPAYLSPEQVLSRPAEAASDVYALGLVLLQCVTGRREFGAGGDALAIAMERLSRDPVIPGDLDPGMAGLLRAMTAREPEDRPTAVEVHDRLAAWQPAERPVAAVSPVVVPAPRAPSRRRAPLVLSAAAVFVAAAVTAAWQGLPALPFGDVPAGDDAEVVDSLEGGLPVAEGEDALEVPGAGSGSGPGPVDDGVAVPAGGEPTVAGTSTAAAVPTPASSPSASSTAGSPTVGPPSVTSTAESVPGATGAAPTSAAPTSAAPPTPAPTSAPPVTAPQAPVPTLVPPVTENEDEDDDGGRGGDKDKDKKDD